MGNAAVKKTTTTNHPQDGNLETFSLVWLDEEVNTTEENQRAQRKLRQILNHLKIYDNLDQCQEYILSLSSQDRLILIVSGRLGQQLIPQIHHLRQVSSIYVYCTDKTTNAQWTKDFVKVKGVIIRLKDLIDQIKSDQKTRVKLEEPLSINISSVIDNSDQLTTGLNGHFVHSLLLIDVLLRMKSVETDKKQLISLCHNAYKNNHRELSLVREFEKHYSSHKALWWYSRQSFLYKMLNKALRVQNIDLLFLFRFVIGDIYRELKQYQYQSPIRVYRGQVMSNDELNHLRQSTGEFISINSFLSTSVNRQKALGFLNSSQTTEDLHRVLFVIDADPCAVTTKPFAEISLMNYVDDESEVLFMIGCTFRLTDISRSEDQIWMIRMKLCNDDENELKNLFDHIKKDYGCSENEVDLLSFGVMLHQMGKFDLAEKMYCRLLKELPRNDPLVSDLYHSLGRVTKGNGDYDMSLQWYHKSLEIKLRTQPSNYIVIGNLYNCIGRIYRCQNNDNEALEWYNKAIELFKHASDESHSNMAYFYNNGAIVYMSQEKYSEALNFYEKSLAIREKHLPLDHPDMGTAHNNIGTVHYHLGQYDLAMKSLHRSLKNCLKSLPPQHPDVANTYENIGCVHDAKGDFKQALKYYQIAAVIYRHSLPSEHPDVLKIERYIEGVLTELK